MQSPPLLRRLQNLGATTLLAITVLVALVLIGHVYGPLGPPRSGSTIHRLLSNPGNTLGTAALIFGGIGALCTPKANKAPALAVFFAGVLCGVGLTNAFFYDSWLGAMLLTGAAPIYAKASSRCVSTNDA